MTYTLIKIWTIISDMLSFFTRLGGNSLSSSHETRPITIITVKAHRNDYVLPHLNPPLAS